MNIFFHYHGYLTIKDLKYVKTHKAIHLYLIFNKLNGYFEEVIGNKYLRLVHTNESKEKILKNEELWSKTIDLIRLLKFKMELDISCYLIVISLVKLVIESNIL